MLIRRIAALIAVVVATVTTSSAADAPPVKVGIVYSFSGAGGASQREFDGAVAVWRKHGGDVVNGRKIELLRRDDTGIAPDTARRLAQELVVQEHVDLLAGAIFTPNAIAIGTVSTQAKIPFLIVNATTSGILARMPYAARYSMTSAQVTAPLARFARSSGARNAFIAYLDYGPGIDSAKTFRESFTAEGGTIAGEVAMPVAATDFSAYIQRIRDAKPDALYIFLNASGQGVTFLKQAKQAALQQAGIKIYAAGDLLREDTLDAIGDAAVGVLSSMNYSSAHPSKTNIDFIKEYRAFAREVPTFGAVQVYDTLNAITRIVGSTSTFEADKVVAAEKGLRMESPRGPLLIDPDTRDVVQNVYIRRTEPRNGKLQNTEIITYPMFRDPYER